LSLVLVITLMLGIGVTFAEPAIGGLKVVTEQGWFAARPSGTEEVYKLYAESFRGSEHLARIQQEAQAILTRAFAGAGA
jgi:phosphoglucomutase